MIIMQKATNSNATTTASAILRNLDLWLILPLTISHMNNIISKHQITAMRKPGSKLLTFITSVYVSAK